MKKHLLIIFLSLIVTNVSHGSTTDDEINTDYCTQSTQALLYYGKDISEMRKINPTIDKALNQSWWDIHFFKIKSFFGKQPTSELNRIAHNKELLIRAIDDIDECITVAQQKLSHRKNASGILTDNGNIGLMVAASIMLFPWIIAGAIKKDWDIAHIEREIATMNRTKSDLEQIVTQIDLLLYSAQ